MLFEQIKVKDLKKGDAVALPISAERFKAIVDDQVKEVEIVQLYDILGVSENKLSKTLTVEFQQEAVKGKKQEEPKAVIWNKDLSVNRIIFEEETEKKDKK
jgi:hypothetical protein